MRATLENGRCMILPTERTPEELDKLRAQWAQREQWSLEDPVTQMWRSKSGQLATARALHHVLVLRGRTTEQADALLGTGGVLWL